MGHTGTGPYGSSNDRRDPIGTPRKELPCYYCTSPTFKGWSEGKCPYCGKPKPLPQSASQMPKCSFDTDGDGNCHQCFQFGGCEKFGGPFDLTADRRVPFGIPTEVHIAADELQAKFDFVRQNSPTVATSYRLFEDNEIMALKRAVVGLFESNQLLIEQVAAWKQRF